MKSLILSSILILGFSLNTSAQDYEIEKLMTRRALDCSDIAYNCFILIPEYFYSGKTDSARILLDYWEFKCGLSEPIYRTKILFAMYEYQFNPDFYNEEIVDYLLAYKFDQIYPRNFFYFPDAWEDVLRASDDYDNFTTTLAKEINKEQEQNTIAYLISEFYANKNDSLFLKLQSPEFENTSLKQYYLDYLDKTKNEAEGFGGFLVGYWTPQGENKILGNHPTLGFFVGAKKSKFIFELTMLLRFLKSKNPYNVVFKNEIRTTKEFVGGYIGFDFSREVFRTTHHEFQLLSGLGYDGFSSAKKYEDEELRINVHSFNVNLGLGYRLYPRKYSHKFWGLQIRYNFVNYDTDGGSDLSGNTLSLRLMYGWGGNKSKSQKLEMLGFEY